MPPRLRFGGIRRIEESGFQWISRRGGNGRSQQNRRQDREKNSIQFHARVRTGNAKMLPRHGTDKLKPNNGGSFIEGRFRGDEKRGIRTAREKTLPFPPISVE
jgi:hypothetical protein